MPEFKKSFNKMELKQPPNRHSIRLKEYDYTIDGVYFITICSYGKNQIFGHIANGKMIPNRLGRITEQCLEDIPRHFENSQIIVSIVMPNHVHALIGIMNESDTDSKCHASANSKFRAFSKPVARSLSTIVGSFKAAVTKIIAQQSGIDGMKIWQRGFYEHIIRNDNDLKLTADYIYFNAQNWEKDSEFQK